MVKTIRLKDEKLHSELLKIQGELMSKSGMTKTADDVVRALLKKYGRKV